MAYEAYKANVQGLCDKLGVSNPIQEESLTIESVEFLGIPDFPQGFHVARSDGNRAGRLYLQNEMRGGEGGMTSPIHGSTLAFKAKYARFFTPELWDDCGAGLRTLVFGMKHCTWANVKYKDPE